MEGERGAAEVRGGGAEGEFPLREGGLKIQNHARDSAGGGGTNAVQLKYILGAAIWTGRRKFSLLPGRELRFNPRHDCKSNSSADHDGF